MIPIRNAVPSRYPPVVTSLLIATNCLIFLLQNSLSPAELEEFLRDFALIPARYTAALAYGEAELSAADLFPFFSMKFSTAAGCISFSTCGRSGCSDPRWRIGWVTDAISPFISLAALLPRLRMSFLIQHRSCRHWAPPVQSRECWDATCASSPWRGSSWWCRSFSSRCSSKSTRSSSSVSGS